MKSEFPAVRFEDVPGFMPDAVIDDTAFEVRLDTRDLLRLRGTLMGLARFVAGKPRRKGILILDDPMITEARLTKEWEGLEQILTESVFRRLSMVAYRDPESPLIWGTLPMPRNQELRSIVESVRKRISRSSPRPGEVFYDILRILINHWLKGSGPLTSRSLTEDAGCSYPTLAAALSRLEPYLRRHSDRRVQLKAFPRDEWFRLIANAEKVRQTLHFGDVSGQPRSIDFLLQRFQSVRPPDVAIGGVAGSRRLYPALDLIGLPRLDFVMHWRTRQRPELPFLRQLDPGLVPVKAGEPTRVIVHFLRYPHAAFEKTPDGVLWADPVECLLDLHEMRLESQAEAMLQYLFTRIP